MSLPPTLRRRVVHWRARGAIAIVPGRLRRPGWLPVTGSGPVAGLLRLVPVAAKLPRARSRVARCLLGPEEQGRRAQATAAGRARLQVAENRLDRSLLADQALHPV